MFHHAIRITLPYECCRDIITKWANRSQQVVVYQHDADEEISKTHVHIGLSGCEVKAEALKRLWPDAPGKGNEFWSFKDWIEEESSVSMTYRASYKYVTYMSKGKLSAVFVKNFSDQQLETSRLAWVEPVKADKQQGSSEHIIAKIMMKFKVDDIRRFYIGDDDYELGQCRYNLPLLSDLVRTETFHILWGEKRMAPHASHYKIIAATVFLRICEDANCLNHGVAYMKNLWY